MESYKLVSEPIKLLERHRKACRSYINDGLIPVIVEVRVSDMVYTKLVNEKTGKYISVKTTPEEQTISVNGHVVSCVTKKNKKNTIKTTALSTT